MDQVESTTTDDRSMVVTMLTNAGRGLTRLPVLIMGLGVIAILIGYNGAAGYTALAAQFPYLISGGILGLSLIIVGTGLLVAQSSREDSARIEALLAQLVDSNATADHAPDDLSELLSGRSPHDAGYAPKPRVRTKK